LCPTASHAEEQPIIALKVLVVNLVSFSYDYRLEAFSADILTQFMRTIQEICQLKFFSQAMIWKLEYASSLVVMILSTLQAKQQSKQLRSTPAISMFPDF
jgi:hypothetical protein